MPGYILHTYNCRAQDSAQCARAELWSSHTVPLCVVTTTTTNWGLDEMRGQQGSEEGVLNDAFYTVTRGPMHKSCASVWGPLGGRPRLCAQPLAVSRGLGVAALAPAAAGHLFCFVFSWCHFSPPLLLLLVALCLDPSVPGSSSAHPPPPPLPPAPPLLVVFISPWWSAHIRAAVKLPVEVSFIRPPKRTICIFGFYYIGLF